MSEITTSAELNELAPALAKAQSAIKGAIKDSANPFFKSTYADLDSVWGACREPLTTNGLAIVQSPRAEGAVVYVDTMLLHSSGQWIRGSLSVRAKDESPQAVGSCITYLRRYALQSFAGVAPEDDDAEAATERSERTTATPAHPKPATVKPHVQTRPSNGAERGPTVTHAKIAKEGTNSQGPWTLYAITFSNGKEGTTFSKSIYLAALEAIKDGREVEPVLEGKKLVELRPIFRHNADVETEAVEEGIPF